jgi:hypothetical protein
MMKQQLLLLYLAALVAGGCSSERERVKGYVYHMDYEPIRGGNLRIPHYRFSYRDSLYTGFYRYSKLASWYYQPGDSVWLSFPVGRPEKSKPDTIFFRPKAVVIPKTFTFADTVRPYRSIAEKPLFCTAKNAEDNEPSIQAYVDRKKKCAGIQDVGIVGINVTFSKMGNIERARVLRSSESKQLDDFVKETLLALPPGTPGKNEDGVPEKVGLLLELTFE